MNIDMELYALSRLHMMQDIYEILGVDAGMKYIRETRYDPHEKVITSDRGWSFSYLESIDEWMFQGEAMSVIETPIFEELNPRFPNEWLLEYFRDIVQESEYGKASIQETSLQEWTFRVEGYTVISRNGHIFTNAPSIEHVVKIVAAASGDVKMIFSLLEFDLNKTAIRRSDFKFGNTPFNVRVSTNGILSSVDMIGETYLEWNGNKILKRSRRGQLIEVLVQGFDFRKALLNEVQK